MGWLKLNPRNLARHAPTSTNQALKDDCKTSVEHIETLGAHLDLPQRYPFQPLDVADSELPLIEANEVKARKSVESGGLLLVVNDIVYDCTEFIREHPGGEQTIKSFAGAECSWQFWRFHGQSDLEAYGKSLRVGRTTGLKNKFKEPLKYVGLRKLGHDGWD